MLRRREGLTHGRPEQSISCELGGVLPPPQTILRNLPRSTPTSLSLRQCPLPDAMGSWAVGLELRRIFHLPSRVLRLCAAAQESSRHCRQLVQLDALTV